MLENLRFPSVLGDIPVLHSIAHIVLQNLLNCHSILPLLSSIHFNYPISNHSK